MKKVYSLFVGLILSSSIQSFGQEKKPKDSLDLYDVSLEELMNIEVYTASKKSQKLSETPATTYAFTEDQIKNRGYRSLGDLLQDVPEIEIQRKSDSETGDFFSVRGVAGNEKFVVLLNGFRINAADGTPPVLGKNFSWINAKRVEIILGPASALYGVDAFTGIINIITKTGAELKGGTATSSYGSFNTMENTINVGVAKDKVSFDLFGSTYHSDEPNFSSIYKDEFAWYNNQYKVNGNVLLSPTNNTVVPTTPIRPYSTPTEAYTVNTRLGVGDFQFGYYRNMESHNTSVSNKPEFGIYAKEAVFKTVNESLYGTSNFTSNDRRTKIQSSISTNYYELTPESNFLNTFTSFNQGYKFQYSQSVKLEEQITRDLSENTSIIGGASFQYFDVLPKTGDLPHAFDKNKPADLQNMYYLGTNVTDQNGKDLTVYQDFYNVNFKNTGVYAQLQSKFNGGLSVTLGGRYDYNTRYQGSFNPRAGLVYLPNKKLNFKLLYGEAFLAPSPYKSLQHYGAFVPTSDAGGITGLFGPYWHLPNPDLKPEKMRTLEFSMGYSILENLKASLNVFNNNVEQLITVEGAPNQTFKGIPVAFADRPINKGNSHTYGGTFKIDALIRAGDISINPYLAYTYIDGDINSSRLTYTSKSTIKAGAEIVYKKLVITPRLISRDKSYHPTLLEADGVTPASSKAYMLVNLAARYNNLIKTNRCGVSIFVNVTNLTNQKYYNVPFGGGECFLSTPQDPARVNGGISLQVF